jgi:uncharacterized protein (TIGR01777 family)
MKELIQAKTILIAGGTGLIGKPLVEKLIERGHDVRVLTRSPRRKIDYEWSPSSKSIDKKALTGVNTIINLAGAGIADKRWTEKRKEELINSRVKTTQFLYELREKMPELNNYISASGINCYGYDQPDRKHKESDKFGTDFLSVVVKRWEGAADLFNADYKVAKIRTGVVFDSDGGALEKISKTIKSYVGAPLGTGKQSMPWLTIDDMVGVYVHAAENELEGAYNAVANSHTNKEVTKALAKHLNKPLWLPNVPAFVLKLMLGEMSSVVLDGLQADNTKLKDSGYNFQYTKLNEAISSVYDD